MASALDRLRAGEVVEVKPGKKVRLNLQDKTYETSEGRKIYVGDNEDFFPSNEKALALSREKEGLEREISRAPIGGEFLYQFGQQGIAGGLKDTVNKIMMSGDDYVRRKQAEAQVSNRISEESPWTSGAATVASFAPDIALTGGMSAARAAPTLAALHAGPRIVEEPGQVAAEAALGSAAGFLIDKGASFLNKVAKRRGESRALPGRQAEVESQNLAQQQQYNSLKEGVKNQNAQRLQQYENELNQRKNQMIESKNSRSLIEQENKRLADEYKIAEQRYNESLKGLPKVQEQAQKEYSANIARTVDEIENRFPKNTRIVTSELDVPGFIENTISKSGLAGSREGAQANRILSSLFPEGEVLSSRELAKRYKAIEQAIQKSTPEVKGILNEFKGHIGERLPGILSNQMAYERVLPSFQKQVKKDMESIFKKITQETGMDSPSAISRKVQDNINRYFESLTPQNFIDKVKTQEFKNELMDSILSPWDLMAPGLKKRSPLGKEEIASIPFPAYYQEKFQILNDQIRNRIDNALAKAEIKMIGVEHDAAKRLGKRVERTLGTAPEVTPPNPPQSPIFQQQQPSLMPSLPQKPSLLQEPPSPIPQPQPTLAPAQGFAENAGDLLEKNIFGGKGMGGNPINKFAGLAGLKYALGKAAVPVEAAYLGSKALTSPTATGEALRISFKQGGIQAIDQLAQKYNSYHDGILEDPMERRSINKEIEDNPEIPIEQKALIQSKINRGKSIFERLY